jgi:hypothetical protein
LGKVEAIRTGVNAALGGLIVIVDADSWWLPDTLVRLVDYMLLNGKKAVTGYVHPSDGDSELNPYVVLQQLEYSQGLGLNRCAQSLGDNVLVVSGAIGLFDAEVLRSTLNEKSVFSVAEDLEITLEMRKKGAGVGYVNVATSSTIVPTSFNVLWNQRLRWFTGWLHNTLNIQRFDVEEVLVDLVLVVLLHFRVWQVSVRQQQISRTSQHQTGQHNKPRLATQKERTSRRNNRHSNQQTKKPNQIMRHKRPRTSQIRTCNNRMEKQHKTRHSHNLHALLKTHRQNMDTTRIHRRKHASIHTNRSRNRHPNSGRNTKNSHTTANTQRNRSKNRRNCKNQMDKHRHRKKNNLHISRKRKQQPNIANQQQTNRHAKQHTQNQRQSISAQQAQLKSNIRRTTQQNGNQTKQPTT